jgi:hypothetical protein
MNEDKSLKLLKPKCFHPRFTVQYRKRKLKFLNRMSLTYAWRSHNVVRGGTCRCTHLIVWKEYFAEARIKRIQYSKSVSNLLKTMLHTILNRKSSVNIIQSRLKNIFVTFSLSYIIFYLAFNCLYQKQRNSYNSKNNSSLHLHSLSISSAFNEIRPQEESALTYISGWLVRKVTCSTCRVHLHRPNYKASFLNFKKYTSIKRNPLTASSHMLERYIKEWERIFRKNFETFAPKSGILSKLMKILNEKPLPMVCIEHAQIGSEILKRYILFRLNAYCRFRTKWEHEVRTKKKLKHLNIPYWPLRDKLNIFMHTFLYSFSFHKIYLLTFVLQFLNVTKLPYIMIQAIYVYICA